MKTFTVIAAVVALGWAGTAAAQQFHASDSWAKVRVGGKVCFAAHEHYGMSPLWVSKRGAKAAAVRAWEASTIGEYGKRWGSYRRATGKRMKCVKKSAKWFCDTTARPCRGR